MLTTKVRLTVLFLFLNCYAISGNAQPRDVVDCGNIENYGFLGTYFSGQNYFTAVNGNIGSLSCGWVDLGTPCSWRGGLFGLTTYYGTKYQYQCPLDDYIWVLISFSGMGGFIFLTKNKMV